MVNCLCKLGLETKGKEFAMELSTLRKMAEAAAKERRHTILWDKPFAEGIRQYQTGACHCGAEVQIVTRPMPNEIDIGGSAIAMNCPVRTW